MDSLVEGNHTTVTEFILVGLTQDPVLRVILFIIILGIYLVTVSGNLCTILLIRLSSLVHHPMYYFLSHLAFVDIVLSSSVTPNMLANFMVKQNILSFHGCAFQLGSAAFFGATEYFLLAAMAYDRFMAICNPLLYSTKMSSQVCVQLIIVAYAGGLVNGCTFNLCVYFLPFCGPNRVNHFYCDFSPLVELSCSDVSVLTLVASSIVGSLILSTVLIVVFSYMYILITILKMRSTEGRHKAFSTCTSHLSAVTLYYGTTTFIYVLPKSMYSTDQNKVISVFYMVVIPMLNPLIYTLRNKDIKEALKRQIGRKIFT
ncbi:olfactory receptor 478-like [Perognathus longimembris pacificus]|uniref:olfactory receptor 478-like n=1 Tax=Perognathus longimembris pacificus TaxID=214514 RepID=UPI0020185930|nr:olfactory receptor 478-like [Perognathus longimembris pacificus]